MQALADAFEGKNKPEEMSLEQALNKEPKELKEHWQRIFVWLFGLRDILKKEDDRARSMRSGIRLKTMEGIISSLSHFRHLEIINIEKEKENAPATGREEE